MEKVKCKKIRYSELQALYVIISQYTENINIKTSDFHHITVASVLYDLATKRLKKILEGPIIKNYSFSIQVYQAAALYIVLQNQHYKTDDFLNHVVRKFSKIIQEDFFNRITV